MWQCVDLAIEEQYYTFYTLAMILRNDKGAEVPFPIDRIQSSNGLWDLSEAEQVKKRYGDEIYKLIIQKRVRLGMTMEQVRLSWGEPKKVNKGMQEGIGTTEQWIYDNNYAYFTNDKLTATQ